MSAAREKISCVMPTYGRPEYVDEAVWMFLQQDDPNKELIVLNDCPGQTFEFDHPEVRVINEPRCFASPGKKRNRCIELAEGKWIATWDDDDVYLPWRLSHSRAEMERLNVSFYRPAEFLTYWVENWLHDNRAVPGWCSHPNTVFTKALWRKAGGYPHVNIGEDAGFLDRVHQLLDGSHVTHPIDRDDRFLILRGKSRYAHMSIGGGEEPPDVRPGRFRIEPKPIADPLLRSHYESRRSRRSASAPAAEFPPGAVDCVTIARSDEPAERPVLSVCVSLKNRSRILDGGEEFTPFPNCVRSLATAAAALRATKAIGPVELVVADFASDDWPVREWLPEAARELAWKLLNVDGPFSKGCGTNRAVRHASADRLLLCDADLLLTLEILRRAIETIDGGAAWSLIFQYLSRSGEPGAWEDNGNGQIALSRARFEEAGGVPEFESWGGEDDLFYERLSRLAPVPRERVAGLRHQWHPDRLRHAHYRRPAGADFRDFQKARRRGRHGETAAPEVGAGLAYYGVCPEWSGELTLFGNGRFLRSGADAGEYRLEPKARLILNWDERPRDVLNWDADRHVYQRPDAKFSVRQQAWASRRVW